MGQLNKVQANRNNIPKRLREIFSRLHQLIEQKRFIRGTLVLLRNKCGKKNCKCSTGQRHISLYIRQSLKGKPKMTLIPKKKWEQVQEMNKRYKEIQQLLEEVSLYEWEHLKDKNNL
jgi:hypothetical protein